MAALLLLVGLFSPLRLDLNSKLNRHFLSRVAGLLILVASSQAFLAFFDDPSRSLPARPVSVDLSKAFYLAGLALILGVCALVPALLVLRMIREWRGSAEVGLRDTETLGRLTMVVLILVAGSLLTLGGVRPVPGSSLITELLKMESSSVAFALRGSPTFRASLLLGVLLVLFALLRLVARLRRGALVIELGICATAGLTLVAAVEAYHRVFFFHETDRYLAVALGQALTVLLVMAYVGLAAITLNWLAESRLRRLIH